MRSLAPEVERRRRVATRAIPLAAVAAVAFGAGLLVGTRPSAESESAESFVAAWAAQDFADLRAELNDASRRRYSVRELRAAYVGAQELTTLRSLDPGAAGDPESNRGGKLVTVPIRVETVAFGGLDSALELPFADGGIAWAPHLTFPGLRPGERVTNAVELARRGPILARDRTPLAAGPPAARTSPLGSAAIDVAGVIGEADPAELPALARQGFPTGTPVGVSGLEGAFNLRLAGRPGGELLATPVAGGAQRVLTRSSPSPGKKLKTTIDPELQRAAVAALAGRAGGVAVLDARSGAVRALAGTAFSAPRPPGSTFKVVTTAAALEIGIVSLDDRFPITDGINVGGRFIANAHDEFCGGSFSEAFAASCNAVFAPLGPEIGEGGMIEVAKRFGFNADPTLYGPAATAITDPPQPTIPEDIGDDLDLGVTAIGQGQLLATPLVMASVAQTVASGGLRFPTPVVAEPALQADAEPVRVMPEEVAGQLRRLMVGVVTGGTGSAAALSGIQVAGKTGTAELGPKPDAPEPAPGEDPEQILDAWFTAFAPAAKPRLAIAAVLVDSDADGGEVAAPLAAEVLAAGLLD